MKSSFAYSLTYFASRWKVAWTALALLLVVIAAFYVHFGPDGTFANTRAKTGGVSSGQSSESLSSQFEAGSSSVQNRDSQDSKSAPPAVEDEKSAFIRAMVENDNAKFAAENDPILTPKISADEEREVVSSLERAEAEFRRMEKANTRIVAESGNDDASLVICMTTAPSQDQYRAFVDVLDSATEGLSQFVKDATYKRRKRLLDSYVSYPTPFRVIEGGFSYKKDVNPGAPERKFSFREQYVYKEDAVTLSEDGTVNFSGGGQLGRRFGADGGLSRYGYLFEKYLPASGAGTVQK